MPVLRITTAQIDMTVGALEDNANRILGLMSEAEKMKADVLITPELSLPGYPPEDLLLRHDFIARQMTELDRLAKASRSCTTLVGFAEPARPLISVDAAPRILHNSVALLQGGKIVGTKRKQLLPNYGVFDESRWFRPGTEKSRLYEIAGIRVGVLICEDLWSDAMTEIEVNAGAQILLSVNASPWRVGKYPERVKVALSAGIPVIYLNLVGAQDEVIFDGGSFTTHDGKVIWRAPTFEEHVDLLEVHIANDTQPWEQLSVPRLADCDKAPEAEIWKALVLGIGDYAKKNGFGKAWIGLSGGIDSSVVAALAVDAIGSDNVTGVLMPSAYSSRGSVVDAQALANILKIKTMILPILSPFDAVLSVLHGSEAPHDAPFAGTNANVAEENIQARLRGIYLMALSNKFGGLVLTTGNKSEVAVGYATLYGDMAGGLAPIADVPKTLVYKLANWRNEQNDGVRIPPTIIDKPPSAELAPGQLDSDSLPPYPILDAILALYVDGDLGPKQIVKALVDGGSLGESEAVAVVERVIRLVDRAEYKRRQAPPTLKISSKAFGRDRRLPITNHYRVDLSARKGMS
jgi:NAD+ synthase (glutamine-hydrolysing)